MNILVTGGCGFIGVNLCLFLKKKKLNVSSLDNLIRRGSLENKKLLSQCNIKNYRIDIRDSKTLMKLKKFDFIIHCAAEPSVSVSLNSYQKVFDINLKGTLNILEKCIHDKSQIIFISSSRVYNIKQLFRKKITLLNHSTSSPKSFYGFTKLASEEVIKELSYVYKFNYIINRFGVVSGPFQFGKMNQGFVSLWVWRHISKFPLTFFGYNGAGSQIRDVLHINDLCSLIFIQIKKFKLINNKVFLCGGGSANKVNLTALTDLCEQISGNQCEKIKVQKKSDYDVPFFVASNQIVKKYYPAWKIKKSLNNIIEDLYIWQKQNYNKIKKYF
jgi:CDP-paratose 2-epimerase